MRLLTITSYNEITMRGYVELQDAYFEFRLDRGREPEYLFRFPKKHSLNEPENTLKFRNYDHFVGVCGKFMPETGFLQHPVEIESLDFDSLMKIYVRYPWFKTNS